MKEKTKITLVLGGIVLLIIGAVSVSFAFLSVTKKQDIANSFTSGCLNISIENESSAITLNNTFPITDKEALGIAQEINISGGGILRSLIWRGDTYSFTIKNTCSTSTNYQINLESLNKTTNTLDTQYIKTSLSSDTMDNLIQKLDSNLVTKAYIENAYVSHNLYKGTIDGNSTKEFNLRIWIDYDTTKEQGANKTYTSKINVIANPDIEVTTEPEIKIWKVVDTTDVYAEITGSASTAKYCISNDNKCIPNINITITGNNVRFNAIGKELVATSLGNIEVNMAENKMVCMSLDKGRVYCSGFIDPKELDFSKVATTDEGVYKVSDGMYGGYSYYWRGAVTNNYVKFANRCWRIVRINGDGSIRLIYDGTTCHANGTSTADSIAVASTAYNTSYNQSNYVGWTYTGTNQRTLSGTSSNAKTQLESWYNSNIGNNTTYSSKIADGKYCNDRNVESGYTWAISPSSTFYYAGHKRLYTDYVPTLSCNSGDVYTLKVGLITADEVGFAGGRNLDNKSYYLYNGQHYWTMSPIAWNSDDSNAIVSYVNTNGFLSGVYVEGTFCDLRPVINLRSDVIFSSGNGTLDNPYVVL